MENKTKIKIFTHQNPVGLDCFSKELEDKVNNWVRNQLEDNDTLVQIVNTDTCAISGGAMMTVTYISKEFYERKFLIEKVKKEEIHIEEDKVEPQIDLRDLLGIIDLMGGARFR